MTAIVITVHFGCYVGVESKATETHLIFAVAFCQARAHLDLS